MAYRNEAKIIRFADVQFNPMDGSRAAVLFWAMTSMDLNALAAGHLNPASLPANIQQADVDQLVFAVQSNTGFINALRDSQSAYAIFRAAGLASGAWAVDQRVTSDQLSTMATAL
jgi:hypothetical protein